MRATCIFASITRTREAARNMSLLWLRCSASVLPRVSAMPSPRNCICRVRWESLDRWRHWRSAKSTENSSVSSGMRWGAWLPPFGTARCPLPRLVRKLAAYPRQNQVARALTEVGKLERTAFLLEYFRDESLRRRILIGLKLWGSLARPRPPALLWPPGGAAGSRPGRSDASGQLPASADGGHCGLEYDLSDRSVCDLAQARRGDCRDDGCAYRTPGLGAHQPRWELSFRAPTGALAGQSPTLALGRVT